jgi:transcriptional regulator with XRE-family HTH domain
MEEFEISNALVVGRINKIRSVKSISTASLAGSMGKSQSTVSRVLGGKQQLNLDIINDIALALGVSSSALLMDEQRADIKKNFNLFSLMLCYVRERAGFSLAKAAVHCTISVDELLSLESGNTIPTAEQVAVLEISYGLESGFLSQIWQFGDKFPQLYDMFGEMVSRVNDSIRKCEKIDCGDHRLVDLKKTLSDFAAVSLPS